MRQVYAREIYQPHKIRSCSSDLYLRNIVLPRDIICDRLADEFQGLKWWSGIIPHPKEGSEAGHGIVKNPLSYCMSVRITGSVSSLFFLAPFAR
jgi:hypothetical protein